MMMMMMQELSTNRRYITKHDDYESSLWIRYETLLIFLRLMIWQFNISELDTSIVRE